LPIGHPQNEFLFIGKIAMLTVIKKYRRNNIAQKLVELLCEKTEEMGGHEIVLETECVNLAALRLYESKFLPQ
jgi:peptide alpha-N-acetyltransferase